MTGYHDFYILSSVSDFLGSFPSSKHYHILNL